MAQGRHFLLIRSDETTHRPFARQAIGDDNLRSAAHFARRG